MTPEEKERRSQRRAERSARSLAMRPRLLERPRKETTDVDAVRRANDKRVRRRMRRMEEAARGGWRR